MSLYDLGSVENLCCDVIMFKFLWITDGKHATMKILASQKIKYPYIKYIYNNIYVRNFICMHIQTDSNNINISNYSRVANFFK